MEARMLVGGLAVALGFCAVSNIVLAVGQSLRRRRIALAVQGEDDVVVGLLAWRMRNGFKGLLPLAERLLRFKRVRKAVDEACSLCADRGLLTTPGAALSVALACAGALFLVGALATGGFIAPCALVACMCAIALAVAGNARDKSAEAICEEVPNALEAMSACFGSGFTLLQTFQQVAKEVPGKLGAVFGRCAHILETGGNAEQALFELRKGAHASELAFVAVALDVQHQNGGTLKQVLEAASDSVKGELALKRSLRVQTAQAKLSARVVVVMPFILVAAFSLASPDFLTPFFSSVAGYALLGLAIVMQAAGIILVRRALSVDGVS